MVHLNKFLPQQESFVKSGVSNEGLVLKEAVSLVNPVIEVEYDLDVSGMNSFGTGSSAGGSVAGALKFMPKLLLNGLSNVIYVYTCLSIDNKKDFHCSYYGKNSIA